jgi:hypothetical protein
MLPKIDRDENIIGSPSPLELYKERISRIKAPPAQFGMRSDGQRLPLESIATQERHAVQDLVLDFWQRIAKIMEMGNLKLFSNRRKTRELLKSGSYEEMLKFFQGPLMEWRKCFDRAPQGKVIIRPLFVPCLTSTSPHTTPPCSHHRIRVHACLSQLPRTPGSGRALYAQHPATDACPA